MNSKQRLRFTVAQWDALVLDLRARGQGERESGAFILGRIENDVRIVERWVAYDDIDPASLAYDYVRIEPDAFGRLWDLCREIGLQVIADVHTHPLGPGQSDSDKSHPMIPMSGHLAIILPNFALNDVRPTEISFNIYGGGGVWECYRGDAAADFIERVTG